MRGMLPLFLLVACTAGPPVVPEAPPAPVELAGGGSMHVMNRTELAAHMAAPSPTPRIYNVWATWCAPCVAEMPALEAFAEAHDGRVELWYVNTDHPKVAANQVPRFLVEHGLDDRKHIRPHLDESDLTASIPDFPQVLPVTYVIAADGSVLKTFAGAVTVQTLEGALP